MPSVDDIVSIAESLQKKPLLIDRERCTVVRHRQSGCRRCSDACVFGALKVEALEISVSSTLCVGCGACVVACPTEALIVVQSIEEDVLRAVASQAETYGVANIACARACSKERVDERHVVEVPCLARIDEAMFAVAAERGAAAVRLIDGDCSTCKFGACTHGVVSTIDSAQELIELQGATLEVEYATGLTEDCVAAEDQSIGASRRGFFSEAIEAAKEASSTMAHAAFTGQLGIDRETNAVVYGVRTAEENGLPTFNMPRHEALVNALFELGEPSPNPTSSPSFATVDIDANLCNGCGVCCVFCPTDALTRDTSKKPYTNPRYLEFSASNCVNCGLCPSVCWRMACTLIPGSTLERVFDFEPVTFHFDR